ncbi:hypothetical protein [Polymorphobacter megasporae]|uniref:hypothetical protein n=1 Tax=Glacieibacterium megasporae TaxID=2835787 RepID=UPI001C1E0ADB|nr:hypothetical protein [Polymorphobacter megasporae]UAJ10328.1 hypothetical protein KTC28_00715 [Polymorphobacter megasporae]
MRHFGLVITLAILAAPAVVNADVRGPEGDRGFRYVYPASASPLQAARLYHADLKALANEASSLAAADGGTLSEDHRTYVDTRRAVLDQRYAEAIGQSASSDR